MISDKTISKELTKRHPPTFCCFLQAQKKLNN